MHWDRRFGPYFDGTAFDDLPRKGVPLECFYLPLHENWPTTIAGHYNGGYWADEAFDEVHRRNFVSASRQFAEHINERGWTETLFHCFFNNKVDYKRNGWSRTSSPWLLDEPQNFQDYWALRYFARAFHEGVATVPGKGKLLFAPTSRGQCGSAMRSTACSITTSSTSTGVVIAAWSSTAKRERRDRD